MQAEPAGISLVHKQFEALHYESQLVQSASTSKSSVAKLKPLWSWVPQWNKAVVKSQGNTTFTYVPLHAQDLVEKHKITILGYKKYLLATRTQSGREFYILTYETELPSSEHQQQALSTYSGEVYMINLRTNEKSHTAFQNGVRATRPANTQKNKGHQANETCTYPTTCYWSGTCNYSFNYVYGTITHSEDGGCVEPDATYLSSPCEVFWQLVGSDTYTQCYGDDPGPGPEGPGGTPDDGGPFDPGNFSSEPASNNSDPDLPSDCASWQFRAVGPSGYLACGVTGIEIDLLSQFQNSDGTFGIGLNRYLADLYFEMPGRYSPGEAATICAQIKDEVEEILEDAYRYSYPPDIAQTINSRFISEMRTRIQAYGGRITQRPNYPNTPVGPYSHTMLPNNGGCF